VWDAAQAAPRRKGEVVHIWIDHQGPAAATRLRQGAGARWEPGKDDVREDPATVAPANRMRRRFSEDVEEGEE
jgi:hypothetical protein